MECPPESSIRRALRCTDITLEIFELLLTTAPLPERSACARCARTCRAFYEPAVRVLWRELPSLDPFWAIVPKAISHPMATEMDAVRGTCFRSGRRSPMWASTALGT
ncbi:hypothetical protein BD413DRAFT_37906 [Trametes elegans]|nr:hypothetical protein BD413DRAFT_37906 [Trametes elegans]